MKINCPKSLSPPPGTVYQQIILEDVIVLLSRSILHINQKYCRALNPSSQLQASFFWHQSTVHSKKDWGYKISWMQRVGANKPCISSNFAGFCSGFWRVVWTRFQRLQMLRCAVGGDAGGSTYVKVTLADWLMRERRSFTQRRTDMLCYPTSSRSLVKYCNTTLLVQEQWVCGVVVLWEDQCLQVQVVWGIVVLSEEE